MSDKKISELTLATPSGNSVVPCSNSSGTSTNKITLQSILDLENRWNLFLPPVPMSLVATGGNAQVALSWAAPTVLAQTPITDYVVQFSSDSGSTWTTFADGTSTATSATVTGLSNGTTYLFRVAAVNGVGTGAYATTGNVTPAIPDPNFASVFLLLHMDGANSGTSFVDSSSSNRAITRTGSAVTSTSQSKFGGASARTGTSSTDGVSAPAAAISMSGDFTIEGWYYPNTAGSDYYGYSANVLFSSDANSLVLLWSINSTLYFLVGTGSGNLRLTATASLATGAWTHVALTRSSGNLTLWLNGTSAGTGTYGSGITGGTFARVGQCPIIDGSTNYSFDGWIDDFRITSVARYSTTFTPSTTAFSDS